MKESEKSDKEEDKKNNYRKVAKQAHDTSLMFMMQDAPLSYIRKVIYMKLLISKPIFLAH